MMDVVPHPDASRSTGEDRTRRRSGLTIGMGMSAVAALGMVSALVGVIMRSTEGMSGWPHAEWHHAATCVAGLVILSGLSVGAAMRLGFHSQMAAIGLAAGTLLALRGFFALPIDREWGFSYWVLACVACLCVAPQLVLRYVPASVDAGRGRLLARTAAWAALAGGLTVLLVLLVVSMAIIFYDIFGI